MNAVESKRAAWSDFILAAAMIVGGFVIIYVSMLHLSQHRQDTSGIWTNRKMAQTTQPSQDAPSIAPGKDNGPAESKPGGTRPTTPAPEPARPDADAQKAGAVPALPAAPAEKIGEPVQK